MAELLRRHAPLLLAIVAIVGGCAAFRVERHRILHDTLQPDRVVRVKALNECSGLAWWPAHRHLLSVGDNGIIAELTLDGDVVRSRHFDRLDLEDIVLIDDDTAVVVAEQQHLLAKVRLSDLSIIETHELPLISPVRGMNRLFEGLTLDPLNGRFVLAHEDHPAAIVRLAGDGQTVDHTTGPGPWSSRTAASWPCSTKPAAPSPDERACPRITRKGARSFPEWAWCCAPTTRPRGS